MSRCVINVATGRYVVGQQRLKAMFDGHTAFMGWADELPPGSLPHATYPYNFKSNALRAAAEAGHDVLLWTDACIVPYRSLDPLWDRIETTGAWISRNGWMNSEWSADPFYLHAGVTREQNAQIPHVVATAFGLDLRTEVGRGIYEDYLRLSQTPAIQGPWCNRNHPQHTNAPRMIGDRLWCDPCGPPDVIGARHDQAILSVLAWKYGVELTSPPQWFSYRGGEVDSTILIADGKY